MHIKNAEILEKKLDEVKGVMTALLSLSIEVVDGQGNSYITELDLKSPPISTWDKIDAKSKEQYIKRSLKSRSY